MDPLALVCSVQLEADPLLDRLEGPRRLASPTLTAWEASLEGRAHVVVVGGMGKTNAARSVTALLEGRTVAGVIGFGVAGAYPGAGLPIGEVAVAEVEHYGDEGALTPAGWISCEGIGIPLLQRPDVRIFNEMPVDGAALRAVTAAAARAGRKIRAGPFVTVSTCSGTHARGAELEARYGAICETMEGAAYAHVAALYGVPFAEVRGISNLVENRDPSRWRLAEAADAAAELVAIAASSWPYSVQPQHPKLHR